MAFVRCQIIETVCNECGAIVDIIFELPFRVIGFEHPNNGSYFVNGILKPCDHNGCVIQKTETKETSRPDIVAGRAGFY